MLIVKMCRIAKKKREIKESFPELQVLQDADKLDAMGGIGIARCVGFGCQKNITF